MRSTAASSTVSVTPSAAARCTVALSIRRAMAETSARLRRRNTTVESMRLRNSGLKVARSSAMTVSFTRAKPPSLSSACAKPSFAALDVMAFAPTFEVMTSTVLRKSTRRPCASVSTPSSKICSSRFHTSSCAFSISSKSTTDHGRRRTFSVSCPPSS